MKPEEDVWLRRSEAAQYLRLSVSALAHMACDGRGPRYFGSGKLLRYRMSDLYAWQSRIVNEPMPQVLQQFVEDHGGMSGMRRKAKRDRQRFEQSLCTPEEEN